MKNSADRSQAQQGLYLTHEQEFEMSQASKMRHRQVDALAAESLMTAAANLGQPPLRRLHHASAVLEIGGSRLGRTAQEREFVRWLIETISASRHQRTMSKKDMISRGRRQIGLSERRAKALREQVIDHLDAEAWLRGGAPKGERRRTR